VIEAARPHGYTVFIDETRGDPDAEREVARGFSVRLIDGIVFSPLGLTLAEADALRGAVPMVLLGEGGDVPLGTDHVSIDNVRAAEEATAHLIAAGRTRLAFLGAEDEAGVSTGALRVRGFRRAHEAAGLAVDERWLLPGGDYTRAEGDAAIRSVLARIGAVDGIVCANDELALGAAHALRTNGIRVPDDVAITGFDDTEDGRYANPSLTTVAPDVVGLAEYAVARVLAQLEGDAGAPRDEVVPHRLLVRESSARR
jgi:DNA-binding LacI/PurR family transcriptional regulator